MNNTVAVVQGGISQGIEKANKYMMPALFIMFLLLALRSLTLDGAWAGVAFLFTPDWSFLTPFKSKLRHSPLVFTVDSVKYIHERPVATQQTGFSFIAQMRNWLPHYIGGVLWFGVDDAACSVYVPMYCGIDSIPWCYDESNGSLLEYSASSAFWVHNRVSNFAYSKYSFMMPDIQKVQQHWEMDFDLLVPATDKAAIALPEADARKLLTIFSMKQAENVTEAWRKLGEYLLVKYLDGNIKREKDGKFVQNEAKIPVDIIRPGYPTDFLRQLVKEKPDTRLLSDEEMKNRQ